MWTSLRRVPAFVLTSMLLTAMAYAGDDGGQGPSARGPIFVHHPFRRAAG